jgi:hypothetical protein
MVSLNEFKQFNNPENCPKSGAVYTDCVLIVAVTAIVLAFVYWYVELLHVSSLLGHHMAIMQEYKTKLFY